MIRYDEYNAMSLKRIRYILKSRERAHQGFPIQFNARQRLVVPSVPHAPFAEGHGVNAGRIQAAPFRNAGVHGLGV